ncbi:MAG: CopD family protein [Rhodospirillales bacterium]|nr:CopD family protein [Rhodospirillales bacterium]MDE2200084.1 CopD family protein [Rhodospirillales bacterium]MDE2574464.1 CopD family protein [Rhodospirillales bacterium]
MTLLVDLFGYLSVVVHGLTITAQSLALGGILFLVFLARPLARPLGSAGAAILRDTARIAAWAALALILCEAATLSLEGSVLAGTLHMGMARVLGADFALAGLVKIVAAALIGLLLVSRKPVPAVLLLAAGAVELLAATLTTHAAARLDNRLTLLAVAFIHQLGAAIWIGGIPAFIAALARVEDGQSWRRIGARFSRMSMAGVACIVLSGAAMSVLYIGSWQAFYGTAYGVMVGAKIAMFVMLLGLGYGNFRTVEALRANPATPVLRMRRFAEVELGIGISIFFAAASLTSVPPAIDLPRDQVSWQEIAARNSPVWPRLASPDHDTLTLPALQEKLDAEAAAQARTPLPAFIPGSGEIAPRNAADIAWSEYNHHWAGIFMLVIGLLAVANQAGLRAARHWPLLFLVMAVFLFFRSDPEVWPLGEIGFFASLRDIEVLQHRFFVLLIAIFGVFEWRVRVGAWTSRRAALVFPLITAIGGAALLTHSHAIANIKDQLLIELTHTPLAITGIAAGWARWLELRLPGRGGRIAGWVWPICFVLVGLMLLNYREA